MRQLLTKVLYTSLILVSACKKAPLQTASHHSKSPQGFATSHPLQGKAASSAAEKNNEDPKDSDKKIKVMRSDNVWPIKDGLLSAKARKMLNKIIRPLVKRVVNRFGDPSSYKIYQEWEDTTRQELNKLRKNAYYFCGTLDVVVDKLWKVSEPYFDKIITALQSPQENQLPKKVKEYLVSKKEGFREEYWSGPVALIKDISDDIGYVRREKGEGYLLLQNDVANKKRLQDALEQAKKDTQEEIEKMSKELRGVMTEALQKDLEEIGTTGEDQNRLEKIIPCIAESYRLLFLSDVPLLKTVEDKGSVLDRVFDRIFDEYRSRYIKKTKA